ncbi:hypothetical protein [Catellatospora sp. NPDC049133]|jgi:hypothetical protein|uniref:hypothetical protein n=1 Tax=Catellatospora sp. NPDC049133 TaxID=3155499 RepID=UPI0033DDB73B
MKPLKSPLGKIAVWLGIAGLVLLLASFSNRVTTEIDIQHGRVYLLAISLAVLTWAVVFGVGEAIIRELREHELTRRVLRGARAE